MPYLSKPKLLLTYLLALAANYAFSQQPNPFRSIGKKADVIDISQGRYVEIIEKDSVERIGSVLVNRYTRKIERLLDESLVDTEADNTAQSRFFSVDPLTTKFPELSPYQYASNRPIDGTDLDGLEWQSSGKYFNSVTGKYNINYKVTMSLNNDKSILNMVNNKAKLSAIEKTAEQTLSKLDAKGTETDPIINVDKIFTDQKGTFNIAFFNAETVQKIDPKTGKGTIVKNEKFAGKTSEIGNTQTNLIQIPLTNTFVIDDGKYPPLRATTAPGSDKDLARSVAHELGHTAGLRHPFNDPLVDEYDVVNSMGLLPMGIPMLIIKNLMNSPGNPIPGLNPDKLGVPQGTELTPEQRKKIENSIQSQQPNTNN